MRPKGTSEELEHRRIQAVALLREGHSLNEVARRIGCHPSSVMRWRNALEQGGKQALRSKQAPGRPPRLTGQQKTRLATYLARGPQAYAYDTEVWTSRRVAEVIRRELGIAYNSDYVGRLLRAMGWSFRKPDRPTRQRGDDSSVAQRSKQPAHDARVWYGWTPPFLFVDDLGRGF